MDLPVPSSKKHSVNEQMIFAIIPFVDLYASFRVEKLRIYILVNIGMAFMDWSLYDVIGDAGSIALYIFVFIPIAVYLMRLWTIQWNAQMELEQEEESQVKF